MPRHSPCALCSLIFVVADFALSRFVAPPLLRIPASLGFALVSTRASFRPLLFGIMQAHRSVSKLLLPFCRARASRAPRSRFLFHIFSFFLLPCFSLPLLVPRQLFLSLFSFQGAPAPHRSLGALPLFSVSRLLPRSVSSFSGSLLKTRYQRSPPSLNPDIRPSASASAPSLLLLDPLLFLPLLCSPVGLRNLLLGDFCSHLDHGGPKWT